MSTKITKKVVMYVAAVLVLLTLVCMCLLGNTYARYTTGVKGSAGASVSYWEVSKSGDLTNSTMVELSTNSTNGLSPSSSGYESGATRYNSTTPKQIAVITISANTDVNATVYITADAAVTPAYTGTFSSSGTYSGEDNAIPTQAEVQAVFKLHVAYTTTASPSITLKTDGAVESGVTEITVNGEAQSTASSTAGTATTVYVYAWMTWQTSYSTWTGTNSDGIYVADALDAWIGKNITSVSSAITVHAIQSSEQK